MSKNSTTKIIGENVLRLRKEMKLTQDELARRIKLKCKGGGSQISTIESGTGHSPNLRKLELLAKALETTVETLITKHAA